jgi:hypothetical protein|tara:strand:+ start:804 stop:1031 length:228 start_codon:yes stop_codon:yes gene_type:complete
VFEVYDKRRCEVIAQTDCKTKAVELGKKSLMMAFPSRRLEDIVIRKSIEPPISVSRLPGFLDPNAPQRKRKPRRK